MATTALGTPSLTSAFTFQAWAAFATSATGTLFGIWQLPVGAWERGFLAMAVLFTITSCFTLAKVIRDQVEATRAG